MSVIEDKAETEELKLSPPADVMINLEQLPASGMMTDMNAITKVPVDQDQISPVHQSGLVGPRWVSRSYSIQQQALPHGSLDHFCRTSHGFSARADCEGLRYLSSGLVNTFFSFQPETVCKHKEKNSPLHLGYSNCWTVYRTLKSCGVSRHPTDITLFYCAEYISKKWLACWKLCKTHTLQGAGNKPLKN